LRAAQIYEAINHRKPTEDELKEFMRYEFMAHHTNFASVDPLIRGRVLFQLTGAHYQGAYLDLKTTTKGRGIQYLIKFNAKGEIEDVIAMRMESGMPPVFALPGYVDIVVNLGGLEFTDFRTPTNYKSQLSEEQAEEFARKAAVHSFFMNADGKPAVVWNPANTAKEAREGSGQIRWLKWTGSLPGDLWDLCLDRTENIAGSAYIAGSIMQEFFYNNVMNDLKSDRVLDTAAPETLKTPQPISEVDRAIDVAKKIRAFVGRRGAASPLPNVRSGKKDAQTWGVHVTVSEILESLGADTPEKKEALARKLGIIEEREELKPDDVVSELWLSADRKHPSLFDLGNGLIVPINTLFAFCPEAIFGREHLEQYGPDMGLLIKYLNSAKYLSIQNHAFDEMIIPLNNESVAILGLKDTINEDTLEKNLMQADYTALNRIVLIEGKPYLVPKALLHAYGPVFVLEVKEQEEGAPDGEATNSPGDRLSAAPEKRVPPVGWEEIRAKMDTAWESGDEKTAHDLAVRLAESVGINPDRTHKDILTQKRSLWQRTLSLMKANDRLKKTKPSDYEATVVEGVHIKGVGQYDILGPHKGFIVERYIIESGQTMKLDPLVNGKFSTMLIRQGKATLRDAPDGKVSFTLRANTEDQSCCFNFAANPVSVFQSEVSEGQTVIEVIYKPLANENLVLTAFEAIRADQAELKKTPIALITTAKAFKGDGPGSYLEEKKALRSMSEGKTELVQLNNLADLQGLLQTYKDSTCVVQLTANEINEVNTNPALAQLKEILSNTRMIPLPNVDAGKKGVPFIREILYAAEELALLNAKDFAGKEKTPRAVRFLDIMRRLTRNKGIDFDMLATYLEGRGPDPVSSYNDRAALLTKELLITMPAKAEEADKELHGRRALLLSV